MNEKRELSDEVLDRVAGGLSKVSGGDFAGIYTYGPSGPAAAGPGAGQPATIGVDSKGTSPRRADALLLDDGSIDYQLKRAGTYEQYYSDLIEYNRQYAEWEETFKPKGYIIPDKYASAGPEPVPPNPYDYL